MRFWRWGIVVIVAMLAGLSFTAVGSGASRSARAKARARAASVEGEPDFQVVVEGKAFHASLPGDSVGTYLWRPGSSTVESWVTTPEMAQTEAGVAQQPNIVFGEPSVEPAITVEPGLVKQEVEGFGGAMTESAASVIKGSSSHEQILEKLFAPPPKGAGFSIVRVPMGPSDFTVAVKTQPRASNAAKYLASELTTVAPELQTALTFNSGLKILGTPWSAPGEWKTGKKLIGAGICSNNGAKNRLSPTYFGRYAEFLTEATKAFQEKDGHVPLWMLSLQNEPRACNESYPTMVMEPEEEAKLSNLVWDELHGPGSGLTHPPQLLGWDHNWSEFDGSKCDEKELNRYPEKLFSEGNTPNHVEALGFHGYCGEPRSLDGQASERPLYLTESTGSEPEPKSGKGVPPDAYENLPNEVQKYLIGALGAGARGSLYWNLALNTGCGPQYGGGKCSEPKIAGYGGCQFCRPMITVGKKGKYGDYAINEDYYYWAQLSEFAPPGSHVIYSSPANGLDSVAFKTPDGAIVVVVLNLTSAGGWTETKAADKAYAMLWSVSCTSATNCTAVGEYGFRRSLVETWNGSSWNLPPVPEPTDAEASQLHAVSCASARSCVAIGEYNPLLANLVPYSVAWDGAAWSVHKVPTPAGALVSDLRSLSCSEPAACTAVGWYEGDEGAYFLLAERWNGSSWKIQTIANPSEKAEGSAISLDGVSCASDAACTAVGDYVNRSLGEPVELVESWNGSSWSTQSTLETLGASGRLESVSCTLPTACTAVGFVDEGDAPDSAGPRIERWNGAAWTTQASAGSTSSWEELDGVSCVSATECIAVGHTAAVAERWQGASWEVMPHPEAGELWGVSCTSSPTSCMAIAPGLYNDSRLLRYMQ